MTPDERKNLRRYRNKLAKLMLLADVMNVDQYELLRKFRQAKADNSQEARTNTQEMNGKGH
jgi:hypothetical protein